MAPVYGWVVCRSLPNPGISAALREAERQGFVLSGGDSQAIADDEFGEAIRFPVRHLGVGPWVSVCPVENDHHQGRCAAIVDAGAYNPLDGDPGTRQCGRPAAFHFDNGFFDRIAATHLRDRELGRWTDADQERFERDVRLGRYATGCGHACARHAPNLTQQGMTLKPLPGVTPEPTARRFIDGVATIAVGIFVMVAIAIGIFIVGWIAQRIP